jgi:hypothetical protein
MSDITKNCYSFEGFMSTFCGILCDLSNDILTKSVEYDLTPMF